MADDGPQLIHLLQDELALDLLEGNFLQNADDFGSYLLEIGLHLPIQPHLIEILPVSRAIVDLRIALTSPLVLLRHLIVVHPEEIICSDQLALGLFWKGKGNELTLLAQQGNMRVTLPQKTAQEFSLGLLEAHLSQRLQGGVEIQQEPVLQGGIDLIKVGHLNERLSARSEDVEALHDEVKLALEVIVLDLHDSKGNEFQVLLIFHQIFEELRLSFQRRGQGQSWVRFLGRFQRLVILLSLLLHYNQLSII